MLNFQSDLRELELNKKYSNEDSGTFLTRWREKAVQMTNRPSNDDQVRLVIGIYIAI